MYHPYVCATVLKVHIPQYSLDAQVGHNVDIANKDCTMIGRFVLQMCVSMCAPCVCLYVCADADVSTRVRMCDFIVAVRQYCQLPRSKVYP